MPENFELESFSFVEEDKDAEANEKAAFEKLAADRAEYDLEQEALKEADRERLTRNRAAEIAAQAEPLARANAEVAADRAKEAARLLKVAQDAVDAEIAIAAAKQALAEAINKKRG